MVKFGGNRVNTAFRGDSRNSGVIVRRAFGEQRPGLDVDFSQMKPTYLHVRATALAFD
jgi:hypothetical protein